jgi:acetyl esterase
MTRLPGLSKTPPPGASTPLPTLDPRSVSPLKSENLAGLPPTLVVTAALDPIADHGRRYAERLREDGTDARLTRYPKAVHSFLSIPGPVPAARPTRREILAFLRGHLHPEPHLQAAGPGSTKNLRLRQT